MNSASDPVPVAVYFNAEDHIMKFSSFKRTVLAGAVALFGVAAVQATPLAGQFFPGYVNQLSDNNAEYLLNADGTLSNESDSKLDIGDRLVGSFTIETIENLTGGGTTNNINATGRELTGIFDIKVTNKIDGGALGFFFEFEATGADGIAVRIFDDAVQDYSRIDLGGADLFARLAALMDTADGGLPFVDLIINQYWTATAPTDDISVIGATAPGQAVGQFLVSLSVVNNNSGLDFGLVDCGLAGSVANPLHQTEVCGSGSFLGTAGVVTPFDSFSNVDFTVFVNQQVPEPGTLALVGLALAGIGASQKRRKAA